MAYTPINGQAFVSAYAGAMAGMAASGWLVSTTNASYSNVTKIAGAFAQAFDQAWNNATPLTSLEYLGIATLVGQDFQQRAPGPLDNPKFQTVVQWQPAARACVAAVLQSDAYMAGQGVVPPGVAGYTVLVNGVAVPVSSILNFINVSGLNEPPQTWITPVPGLLIAQNGTPQSGNSVNRLVECLTGTGTTDVTMPNSADPGDPYVFQGVDFTIYDSQGQAAGNNITVHPAADAVPIENPQVPGSYSFVPFALATNNCSATWRLSAQGKWKCTSFFH